MKGQALESICLAWRDWRFEFLLSFCGVIALASMLAPVLILLGLENGVIDGMRTRLLEDPSVLIITPKSDAGRFSGEMIAELAALPGARYAIGRTRSTAADITLRNPDTGKAASIALEPATPGEPVLEHANLMAPNDDKEPQIILSAPTARALDINVGSTLGARLNRKTPAGKLESQDLILHVTGILPESAADRKMAFVPLELLEDIENYRDYLEVPRRGFTGEPNPNKREYSSFRLYASNLDSVESLADQLAARKIEISARTRDIAAIRSLKNAINEVILIISLAIGAGFAAFTISSALSAVSRKKRMLGMLRLLGMRRLPLVIYPITQTLLTAISGFLLSLLIYIAVSVAISHAFADQGSLEAHLTWQNIAVIGAGIFILSILSSIKAAYKASSVEPSVVIREV